MASQTPLSNNSSSAPEQKTDGVPRRSVVAGMAWTVPVIATATAAPFAAASQCVAATLDWNAVPVGPVTTPITVPGTSPAVTATFTTSYSPGTSPFQSGRVSTGPQGGVSGNYYRLGFYGPKPGHSVTVTITFNRPVTDLSFSVLDIDTTSNGAGYRDYVEVSPLGYTSVKQPHVIGAGTAADPFRQGNPLVVLPATSSEGNVALSWSGPLTSVTLRYYQPNIASNALDMVIGIGNLSMEVC